MDIAHRKEQFSHAYVRAVAAVAGFAVAIPNVDDDSIDMTLSARGDSHFARRPKLDIQLKCTSGDIIRADEVVYPLKLKNYDELRVTDLFVPRLLVVVHVPESDEDWLRHSESELTMRRCGYWVSLFGRPEASNSTTVTVRWPRSNAFDVAGLRNLMRNAATGELS